MLHDMYSYIHLHSQVRTLTHAQFTCPHSCCLVKFCSRPTATLSSSRQIGKARSALTDLCVQRHSSRPGCFAFSAFSRSLTSLRFLESMQLALAPPCCANTSSTDTLHTLSHTHTHIQALDDLCCRLQCHTHTHTHGCTFIHKGPTPTPFKCDPCTWAWA